MNDPLCLVSTHLPNICQKFSKRRLLGETERIRTNFPFSHLNIKCSHLSFHLWFQLNVKGSCFSIWSYLHFSSKDIPSTWFSSISFLNSAKRRHSVIYATRNFPQVINFEYVHAEGAQRTAEWTATSSSKSITEMVAQRPTKSTLAYWKSFTLCQPKMSPQGISEIWNCLRRCMIRETGVHFFISKLTPCWWRPNHLPRPFPIEVKCHVIKQK